MHTALLVLLLALGIAGCGSTDNRSHDAIVIENAAPIASVAVCSYPIVRGSISIWIGIFARSGPPSTASFDGPGRPTRIPPWMLSRGGGR